MAKRKCKTCGETFEKKRIGQLCCSIECAITYIKKREKAEYKKAMAAAKRKERAYIKARKHQMATIPELTKKAQRAFNAYIRARDEGKACISCGMPLPANTGYYGYDAGHYRSVGAAPHLRFNENNCMGQCRSCNHWKSGNVVDYRLNLIQRIGIEEVEKLEADNEQRHYSKDELREIEATYKAKLKELKRAAG